MTEEVLLLTLIGILSANFILEQTLRLLNLKKMADAPPESVQDVYEADQYEKSQKYNRTRTQFSLGISTVSFIATLLFLALGGFGWLDGLIRTHLTEHSIGLPLVFFGILYLSTDLLSTPISLFSTFVIEEKYGFNKMKLGTWLFDKVKGYGLALLLGAPLILLLLWLIDSLGANFWLWFWGIVTVYLLLMNFLYPTLIVPLFNKLTPLEPGELKSAIEDYGKKVDFPMSNVMVLDGSKRSTKANAFFAGLGKTKRVVLYDTLIEQNTTEELVAVLAHEIGHFKRKHIPLNFVLSALQMGLTLFLLSLLVNNETLSLALGAKEQGIHLSLIGFGLLYSPISLLMGLFMNGLSRKNEFEADRYAVETSNGSALITALKKLARNSLSNLSPHPANVFVHFSHPPLDIRIKAISLSEKAKNNEKNTQNNP